VSYIRYGNRNEYGINNFFPLCSKNWKFQFRLSILCIAMCVVLSVRTDRTVSTHVASGLFVSVQCKFSKYTTGTIHDKYVHTHPHTRNKSVFVISYIRHCISCSHFQLIYLFVKFKKTVNVYIYIYTDEFVYIPIVMSDHNDIPRNNRVCQINRLFSNDLLF